ncbi:Hypothetical predicted protein [Pelobates cultripes]|uniref:Uncharacterized protein n=1 Tax=Pelobates cultripes TaxID=61616 RepID=A0AAD1T761_PELCU|nr:Hypothetical predicted protein [Pelobates cultripes]
MPASKASRCLLFCRCHPEAPPRGYDSYHLPLKPAPVDHAWGTLTYPPLNYRTKTYGAAASQDAHLP